jgi:Raf kinase inhibitor-like YbhB/YbcL family protein
MKSFLVLVILIAIAAAAYLGFNKYINNGSTNEMAMTDEGGGNMKITSSAFNDNEKIGIQYTCDAEDINPPLTFSEIPENTKSLALILTDPDAPVGTFTHWTIWNISPDTTSMEPRKIPEGSVQGKNGFGQNKYNGPCPPTGEHRYLFTLYALDTKLDIDNDVFREVLEKAMTGHIIEKATLTGKYSRS